MKIRLTHIPILVILGVLISGCSIGGTYYVRNFTSEAARVILTFTQNEIDLFEPTFRFSREIEEIKRNLHKNLDDSMSGKYLTPNTLEIEIPSNSTVLFAIGSNMRMWGIETIRIESRSGIEVINSANNEKLNIRMRGIGRYTGHLDIR